jgi:putative transposase
LNWTGPKNLHFSIEQKRQLIDLDLKKIPVSRQCELLGLTRSCFYYKPVGESAENLLLMRLIDEQYTKTPFYGVKKMTATLRRLGYTVNPKRVRRLMRQMELHAIFPKPKTSKPGEVTINYPYLLQSVVIDGANQVWSTDITYLRLTRGYVYLCVILDWFSRYVLSWELSNSQDVFFCLNALEKALTKGKPEIFNSDLGSQFTSEAFIGRLKQAKVTQSWDGRGRVFDNIVIERLWRTVKYEEVYINDYQSVTDAESGLSRYFNFYNNERIHQSLGYMTPQEVHFGF